MFIESSDTIIAEPSFTLKNENQTLGFQTYSILVNYNCKHNKPGDIKMTMTISSKNCGPFTIYWQKECSMSGTKNLPDINIGFTPKGNDIIKDGLFVNSTLYSLENSSSTNKLIIPKDQITFNLYISSSVRIVYFNI